MSRPLHYIHCLLHYMTLHIHKRNASRHKYYYNLECQIGSNLVDGGVWMIRISKNLRVLFCLFQSWYNNGVWPYYDDLDCLEINSEEAKIRGNPLQHLLLWNAFLWIVCYCLQVAKILCAVLCLCFWQKLTTLCNRSCFISTLFSSGNSVGFFGCMQMMKLVVRLNGSVRVSLAFASSVREIISGFVWTWHPFR